MEPGRFVSYIFVYLGALWSVEYYLLYGIDFGFPAIMYLAGGSFFLVYGLYRRMNPEFQENYPEEHGVETYGFAVIAVILTVIFFLQLL